MKRVLILLASILISQVSLAQWPNDVIWNNLIINYHYGNDINNYNLGFGKLPYQDDIGIQSVKVIKYRLTQKFGKITRSVITNYQPISLMGEDEPQPYDEITDIWNINYLPDRILFDIQKNTNGFGSITELQNACFDYHGKHIKIDDLYDYEYNNKGQITRKTVYQTDGDFSCEIEYYYNESGFIERIKTETGKYLREICEWNVVTDDDGRVVLLTMTKGKHYFDDSWIKFYYDEQGLINRVERSNTAPLLYDLTYNESNLLVRSILYSEDNGKWRFVDGWDYEYQPSYDHLVIDRHKADLGHWDAMWRMAVRFSNGIGVQTSQDSAHYWYHKAYPLILENAISGVDSAQNTLGLLYDNGIIVEKNEATAIEWYQKAAEQGYPYSQGNLGQTYYDKKMYEESAKWIMKAALQGVSSSQSLLGVMYYFGRGVEQSYSQSAYWSNKSAIQGDMRAQFNLGLLFFEGNGVTQSYQKAVEWFAKSAEQGNAQAQFKLAECYKEGYGVNKSKEQAAQWYLSSAEKGYIKAQSEIGRCYLNGFGVQQSFSEAHSWLEKAAQAGEPSAQYSFGMLYYWGQGVQESLDVALKWIQMSADQGYALAQYAIGWCYYEGRGLKKNRKEGKKWILMAAAQKQKEAVEFARQKKWSK